MSCLPSGLCCLKRTTYKCQKEHRAEDANLVIHAGVRKGGGELVPFKGFIKGLDFFHNSHKFS